MRILQLDGLRGIAISLVLIWHYFFLTSQIEPRTTLSYALACFRLSWSGVDLFFVLSGFLICGILLDARTSTEYFKVFYARRFFRIIPIYVIFLLVAFSLLAFARGSGSETSAWMVKDALPWPLYFLFLQNFSMAFTNSLGAFGLAVTWSLAVEEQFYLTLPSLVRFLTTRRLVVALCSGIVAAPALRLLLHAMWPQQAIAWFVLTPCRADALLLGALAAVGLRDPYWRASLIRGKSLLQLCLAVLFAGMGFLTLRAPHPSNLLMLSVGFTWLALFYVSVVVYAVLFSEGLLSRCLRFKVLIWLGSIAYGTYLLHEFALGGVFAVIWSKAPAIGNVFELGATLGALALVLTICHLSWAYFEKPLLRIGHRWEYSVGSRERRGLMEEVVAR